MNSPKKLRQGVTILFIAESLILLASVALISFTVLNVICDHYDVFTSENYVVRVRSLLGLFYFCFILFRYTTFFWIGFAVAMLILVLLLLGSILASKEEKKFSASTRVCLACIGLFLLGEGIKQYPGDPAYVSVVRLFIILLRDLAAVNVLLCVAQAMVSLGQSLKTQVLEEKAQTSFRLLIHAILFAVVASDIFVESVSFVFNDSTFGQLLVMSMRIAALILGSVCVVKLMQCQVECAKAVSCAKGQKEENGKREGEK